MNFVLIRVDNRLVHGQILEGWLPSLNASSIIVVNDEVAADLFRESVIKMAVPSDIEVNVYGIDDFVHFYNFGEKRGRRTICLFKTIEDAFAARGMGFSYDKINIGNVHDREGICCITPATVLNEDSIHLLRSLMLKGVSVEIQSVPRDKPLDFAEIEGKLDRA